MSDQEKRNRRVGMLTSLGVHAALFLALFFLVAWRAPNPPLAEYGIELNFGMDQQGSGEIQPEKEVGTEDAQPTEEINEKPTEQAEQIAQESKEDIKEEVVEKPTEQAVSQIESPVTVKEEKKETKKVPVVEKPVEKKAEVKPPVAVIAEYKRPDQKEAADASKKGNPGSQGDDTKKAGDKGSPEGKLDAKALYGKPGGGGGGNGMDLQMDGWDWADKITIPDLPENESGRVEFDIECDDSGNITGITTRMSSLSPKAKQLLEEEIRKNSLVRKSDRPAPLKSKGRIIFVVKSN